MIKKNGFMLKATLGTGDMKNVLSLVQLRRGLKLWDLTSRIHLLSTISFKTEGNSNLNSGLRDKLM